MELLDLARKHGADKMVPETFAFIGAYMDHFEKLRTKVTSVLEIGVQTGGSLRMWHDYFPNAQITGIDVDPVCLKEAGNRIGVVIGDQSNNGFLDEFAATRQFDIIVDDGGHKMKHQLRSLRRLWPIVTSGGWYVIEDLHTSYWPKWDGRYGDEHSTISYLKTLLDDVNWRAMVHPKAGEYKREWVPMGIKSLHFYPGIVFIEKE